MLTAIIWNLSILIYASEYNSVKLSFIAEFFIIAVSHESELSKE